MRLLRFFTFCFIFSCFFTGAAFARIDSIFSSLSKNVGDYLDIDTRYAKAEEDAWYPQPFTDTKSSVQDELNDLLDAALESLLDDSLLEKKHNINKLMQANSELEDENADLKMKRLVVPEAKKAYEVWKDDVKGVDEKITSNINQIAANKATIEQEKREIQALLANAGINLSLEEINSLVYTVTGTDTLQAMVVLKNVQGVLEKLKGVMVKENENIHVAKKYYGLFLLSTQAYAHQLDIFTGRIEKEYLPKLAELRSENAKLMKETQALIHQDPTYANNLKAQKVTEEAAKMYVEVLSVQKQRLEERKAKVARILSLAQNTYKTVTIAHSLYETMNEGLNSYQSLMSLPLVDPVPFKNKDMENKFLELTKKLRE